MILSNRLGERERYGGERTWRLTREMEPNGRHEEQKTATGERRAKGYIGENGENDMCVTVNRDAAT